MEQPEYESPVSGFEVWRDEDGTWRGRHKDSGREIHAERWEALVWRAREAVVFVQLTKVTEFLNQAIPPDARD